MHISEQIADALIAKGFEFNGKTYSRLIEGFAEAATLSNGSRVVHLAIDGTGRWLERLDGWGKVEKDVDLRDFSDAESAIAAVIL